MKPLWSRPDRLLSAAGWGLLLFGAGMAASEPTNLFFLIPVGLAVAAKVTYSVRELRRLRVAQREAVDRFLESVGGPPV